MTTERFHLLLAGIVEAELGFARERARTFASGFTNFAEFLSIPKARLVGPISVSGKPVLRLKAEQIDSLHLLRKKRLNAKQSISENYIAVISRKFATRQVEMIRAMNLDSLSVNPLLVKVLNIHTPRELISFQVEMAATRSIVTSMGFYLEQLVWASSDDIEKAPSTSNWDFKMTRGGRNHWLQIKSGPNDMDKDQISHWAKRIEEKISAGDEAYLGFTYGKKSAVSVTLGLLKQYLPDWEMRVIVGKELWQFVSGNPQYHTRLCNILRQAALTVLHKSSIVSELNIAVKRITGEFETKYGHGEEAVEKFVHEIL